MDKEIIACRYCSRGVPEKDAVRLNPCGCRLCKDCMIQFLAEKWSDGSDLQCRRCGVWVMTHCFLRRSAEEKTNHDTPTIEDVSLKEIRHVYAPRDSILFDQLDSETEHAALFVVREETIHTAGDFSAVAGASAAKAPATDAEALCDGPQEGGAPPNNKRKNATRHTSGKKGSPAKRPYKKRPATATATVTGTANPPASHAEAAKNLSREGNREVRLPPVTAAVTGPEATANPPASHAAKNPSRDGNGEVRPAPVTAAVARPEATPNPPASNADKKSFREGNRKKVYKQRKTFEERLQALADYKEQHGDCNVPYAYEVDRSLGDWVKDIRRGHQKVTMEQRKRLSAAGFIWETRYNKREREWNAILERLRDHRERFGDFRVQWKIEGDPSLNEWVRTQRRLHKKGTLRADRKQLLDCIGFAWRDA